VRRIVICGVMLMLIFIWAPAGWTADETVSEGEVYRLGEVVVSETRQGVESVATVREVTAVDIQSRGARTLDEAISLLPGVVVRTGAQGVPRVDIRGFRSRHIVLLLNGIPMNAAWDGQFDPSLIPVENIAKIKISYGNASVLYGDNGLAGVINVITKKGRPGIHGSVAGEAGEGALRRGQAKLSGGSEKIDFFMGASLIDRSDWQLSDDFEATPYEDGNARENSDKRSSNYFANLGFNPVDTLQVGLTVNYLTSQYGIPPATVDRNLDPDFGKQRLTYDRMDDVKGLAGQLSASYKGAGPLNIRGWGFFNSLDEEENRYDDDTYSTITQNRSYHLKSETDVYGGTLQAGYDLKRFGSLGFSLNGRQEKYESGGYAIGSGNTVDPNAYDNDHQLEVYSAGLEYSIEPIARFGLVMGYSYLWQDREDDKGDDDQSYMAGLYYDITTSTRLSGSYAKKVRFPTIRQYYDPNSGALDLSPESSQNYEVALEQMIGSKHVVTLTGFYIDVKDFIEKDDATGLFANNSRYVFQGVEIATESNFTDNLLVRLGYTCMTTEDKSPGTLKDQLQNRPENKFTAEGRYNFHFGLTAYVNIMYLADQYDYSNSDEKEKLNDITTLNLKLDQALMRNRLHLYVGADNLLDNDYDEAFGGYPGPGRYLYGGVEVRF
jgi:vitamin B12 transporter